LVKNKEKENTDRTINVLTILFKNVFKKLKEKILS